LSRRGSRGFTLIEIMLIVSVLGIVMVFAIPVYANFIRNTRAVQAAADLYAVRSAAFLYYGDNSRWPVEVPTGDIPPELVSYLPRGFTFRRPHYTLDYDNWGTGRGRLGRHHGGGIAVGITIQSPDSKLCPTVAGVLGNAVFQQTRGPRYTLEICSVQGF